MKDLFAHLNNLDILYVEDDDSTREELEYFLSTKVNNLYVGKNGQEGYDLFISENPDLIITDIQMPVLNGIEMLKKSEKLILQYLF